MSVRSKIRKRPTAYDVLQVSKKVAPQVQDRFAKPIKAMIEENPSFGYRTLVMSLVTGSRSITISGSPGLKDENTRSMALCHAHYY